jgi:Prophage CP4-57 regulatory protein (AlpA)
MQQNNFDQLPDSALVMQKHLLYPVGPVPCRPSTLWTWVGSGRFPQPIRMKGVRMTVWRVGDVRAWIANQGMAVAA